MPPSRRRVLRVITIAGAGGLLPACKGEKTPRQLIQEAIAKAEEAAEEKDVSTLAELLSQRYRGGGSDRAEVLAMLRLQFLRAQSIHLLVRVPAIHVQGLDRAEATVLVAMASTPIAAAQQLAGLNADLMKLELGLALEEGKWRVVAASWSGAAPGDFL